MNDLKQSARRVFVLIDEMQAGKEPWSRFDEIVTRDFKAFVPGQTLDTARFKIVMQTFAQGFSEGSHTVLDIVAEEDTVMVRELWQGRHTGVFLGSAPSGERVQSTVMVMLKFRDGKGRRVSRDVRHVRSDAKDRSFKAVATAYSGSEVRCPLSHSVHRMAAKYHSTSTAASALRAQRSIELRYAPWGHLNDLRGSASKPAPVKVNDETREHRSCAADVLRVKFQLDEFLAGRKPDVAHRNFRLQYRSLASGLDALLINKT